LIEGHVDQIPHTRLSAWLRHLRLFQSCRQSGPRSPSLWASHCCVDRSSSWLAGPRLESITDETTDTLLSWDGDRCVKAVWLPGTCANGRSKPPVENHPDPRAGNPAACTGPISLFGRWKFRPDDLPRDIAALQMIEPPIEGEAGEFGVCDAARVNTCHRLNFDLEGNHWGKPGVGTGLAVAGRLTRRSTD